MTTDPHIGKDPPDGICTPGLHWFIDGDHRPCQCREFNNAAELVHWNAEGYKRKSK